MKYRGFHELSEAVRVHILIALIIGIAFSTIPTLNLVTAAGPGQSNPRLGGKPLSLAPVGYAASYDEQVGITLTQDFAALVFNVTATAFTDNGIGPGYLVNGLTDRGYWYQVGLSYDWPNANGGANLGFSMNYEVFNPRLSSIYPYNGGGGLQAFNGTVNSGDSVMLNLSFSQGLVIMQAKDWQTKAAAEQSFTAYASSQVFIGLSSSLDQSGFFSGLMTEQYHYSPYSGAGQPATYSLTGRSISSAWLWMDEWNTDTGQTVFRANTTIPVPLDQSVGTYFSSNGTAEIATAHSLSTGLTPVVLPSLLAGSQATGQPGKGAIIGIVLEGTPGATVLLENATISTSFENYSFTREISFSTGQDSLTIEIPPNIALGIYNLTIHFVSWKYLNTQATAWIPLNPVALNETLLVTNNPPSPPSTLNNRGSTPAGHTPSSSTDGTTNPLYSILDQFRSLIIPIVGSYVALGFLAGALLFRQRRKGSMRSPRSSGAICPSCGGPLENEFGICPRCRTEESQAQAPSMIPQTENRQDLSPGESSPQI